MAMNDEETVALIAGGHTFGKTHGAGDPSLIGPEPEGGAIEDQGLGWKSKHGTGIGADAITGGPEVTWTQTPTKWSNHFFDNLFKFEWELTKSPAGAQQWKAKDAAADIPDAHRPVEEACADHADHRPRAALRPGLREDLAALPRESRISSRTRSRARGSSSRTATWARRVRYLGPLVPKETLIWQDPIPAVDHPLIDDKDIAALKAKILARA